MEAINKKTLLKNIREFKAARNEVSSAPNIEMWYDPWVDWVSEHERKKRGYNSHEIFKVPWMTASPFGGLGYHVV